MNLSVAIENFISAYETRSNEYYKEFFGGDSAILEKYTFRVNEGRKYIKLIIGNSVTAFVNKTNGDVLKAASWSSPETKHPRGNVLSDTNGTEAFMNNEENSHGSITIRYMS